MSLTFTPSVTKVGQRNIVLIPHDLSATLPSRGMVMGLLTLKDQTIVTPLEPDGKGTHFFEVTEFLSSQLELLHETTTVQIDVMEDWPAPEIPFDLQENLIKADLLQPWNQLTTKAMWDWIRWIRGTNNPSTRANRIQVACSKLSKGDKRPCCFDRTRCTLPDISKSGTLVEP